ncbi:MAG: iron ABC transporter permease [Hyphomonadaceae bacterium]|nr:iron ABC transporter permease [Hyphomonadaceae bacterium]
MTRALVPLLIALSAVALAAALLIGATPLPLERALPALFGAGAPGDRIVMQDIRLPRAAAAYLFGAALGLCGAALQGLLRNPLAEPGVLGVSATASLFATATIFWGFAAASPIVAPLAAIAGALAATALLSAVALRIGSIVTLILIGVGLSSFAGAAMSVMLNMAPNPFTLFDLINWTQGSVAHRSIADLAASTPFLVAGGAVLFAARRGLSALTVGEEAAAGLGLDLTRLRLAVIAGAGLATGAAVSLAGAIGFVGIVAPHMVRPFVAHDPARTLAPAALLGGALVTLADIIVRIAPTPSEMKLGVVVALIGAPAFVWIAARRRGGDG